MQDLEPGEVRTALQSKLDDMNDRWNSLGVRVVDIRDRMMDGTGEWRQLQLDMQEIIDWLMRAEQELQSRQPIGCDIETVKQQSDDHQLFKGKLNNRRTVIEQAIDQGQAFLQSHDAQARDPNYQQKMTENAMIIRAASNLQKQISHIQTQWSQLIANSEAWQKTIEAVLELLHTLINQIDKMDLRVSDAERERRNWVPAQEITADNASQLYDEIKAFNLDVTNFEPQFDAMDGTAKELRHLHGVSLSNATENMLDQLHNRWKQLLLDVKNRQASVAALAGSVGNTSDVPTLEGSVEVPWERGSALNKVPYYINHTTKTTQWDHPKMTELYQTLSELNDVKFAAYRTSMKLRCIQKAICMDMVDLNTNITTSFESAPKLSSNETLIDVGDMIVILLDLFGSIDDNRKAIINISQSVDMTLNWILNVYDSGRIGKVRVLSFKIGLVLLCRARLEEKYRYLFKVMSDNSGKLDARKTGLMLHDMVQIPRQLGEIAAFGGSNIEPSVRSCFERVKSPSAIVEDQFIEWSAMEPQSLVWMPVMHRLAAAETAKHDAKCAICKQYPIIGFRFKCLKCFAYDMCQSCFWAGKLSKSHRKTHPMHQYSLATTTGEDMSDFVKLMKNKFKPRNYRNRPPKKLGYLPVQTIMEGTNIETPSVPSTPDMSFAYPSMMEHSPDSAGKFRFDNVNEEHRLIAQMCQQMSNTLNSSVEPGSPLINGHSVTPMSPSEIIATLQLEKKQNVDEVIRELEEEHKTLEAEYIRLKGIRASGQGTSSNSLPRNLETASDAEMLAEAQSLKQHKGRLEARMQILEDHNRQLEAQLQRLRQLLEQATTVN